jgi:hypothetical protein
MMNELLFAVFHAQGFLVYMLLLTNGYDFIHESLSTTSFMKLLIMSVLLIIQTSKKTR